MKRPDPIRVPIEPLKSWPWDWMIGRFWNNRETIKIVCCDCGVSFAKSIRKLFMIKVATSCTIGANWVFWAWFFWCFCTKRDELGASVLCCVAFYSLSFPCQPTPLPLSLSLLPHNQRMFSCLPPQTRSTVASLCSERPKTRCKFIPQNAAKWQERERESERERKLRIFIIRQLYSIIQ